MSTTAPLRVEFEDNRLVQALVGSQGMHLKLIERRLGVQVAQRGGQLFVGGDAQAVGLAQRLLTELYELLRSGYPLYAEDVELRSAPKVVGDKHLKFTVGAGGSWFDAIAFNLGYLREYVMDKPRLAKIAFYPEWNTFRGERKIQLRIVALE